MPVSDFVHLHVHSDFSLLDGASSIKKLVDQAKSLGMKHLALTDHGNLFGALRFYKTCKDAGINPIIGSEFYHCDGSRHEKQGGEHGNRRNHLVLLAKNETGYRNLMALSSCSFTEGYYYKPRIDDELLQKHHEGLIALSACLAGEIPRLILNNRPEEAEARARWFADLFGPEHFWIEVQDHGLPQQAVLNKALFALSEKTGLPLVATNDVHYALQEDAVAQDVLLCIGTKALRSSGTRMQFEGNQFYLKSADEMALVFPGRPEVISNSLQIAQMCNLKLPSVPVSELPNYLPEYEIPAGFDTPADYLAHLSRQGLAERYREVTPELTQRLDYELSVITSMRFTGYFLIVWDFIHYAKSNNIPVGPGRGSGAGSLVAYCLRITDIDPIRYHLLFERFLNPERVSMPDFDIDFCFERRQEVIDYVSAKYGSNRVAQIITFGTLKAKAVIKDVARVLELSFAESNEIAKLIPGDPKTTLAPLIRSEAEIEAECAKLDASAGSPEEAAEKKAKLREAVVPELRDIMERGGEYRELFDIGRKLEGLNRHASLHAAGLVIAKTALTDYVPLYRDPKTGILATQFTMDLLEESGLIKMDFLGLKTLTLIKHTLDLIERGGIKLDLDTIPENDPKTFEMLGNGKSTSIFQFESAGMQKVLRQAKPTSIEDLIALNALYRPGPMDNIQQFVDGKWGRIKINYPLPELEPILKETYGVIVYQEQVMEIARRVAGFSLGMADELRRAMGKKKKEAMAKMKEQFVAGAAKSGFDEATANSIFDLLVPFAGYGFNKSHAAAYSVLAYKTAYLKANYPAEFMAANLTIEISNPDKLSDYISETRKMGIPVLPPDINRSDKSFSVSGGAVVFGLVGIKNVGSAAVDEILAERERNGAYQSFMNFLERVELKSVNRKVLETMIACGVFDSIEPNRAMLGTNLGRALEYAQRKKDSTAFGQTSLFGEDSSEEFPAFSFELCEDLTEKQKLEREKELLGFYISANPMDKYRKLWRSLATISAESIQRAERDQKYIAGGIIKSIKSIITKTKQEQMAFLSIEDPRGNFEVTVFPRVYANYGSLIVPEAFILVEGTVDVDRENKPITAISLKSWEEVAVKQKPEIHIRLKGSGTDADTLRELRASILEESGGSEIYLHIPRPGQAECIVRASQDMRITASDRNLERLRGIPGLAEVWTIAPA